VFLRSGRWESPRATLGGAAAIHSRCPAPRPGGSEGAQQGSQGAQALRSPQAGAPTSWAALTLPEFPRSETAVLKTGRGEGPDRRPDPRRWPAWTPGAVPSRRGAGRMRAAPWGASQAQSAGYAVFQPPQSCGRTAFTSRHPLQIFFPGGALEQDSHPGVSARAVDHHGGRAWRLAWLFSGCRRSPSIRIAGSAGSPHIRPGPRFAGTAGSCR